MVQFVNMTSEKNAMKSIIDDCLQNRDITCFVTIGIRNLSRCMFDFTNIAGKLITVEDLMGKRLRFPSTNSCIQFLVVCGNPHHDEQLFRGREFYSGIVFHGTTLAIMETRMKQNPGQSVIYI